jgi:type IV pilus assembly protein PilC
MWFEKSTKIKKWLFEWSGTDRNGKIVRGEMKASGENQVFSALRRQSITPKKIKKCRMSSGRPIKQKDVAIFTRQLATLLQAGIPIFQALDILARGSNNPKFMRLVTDIRADIETGASLSSALKKYPNYFDALYCNLVYSGESAGVLDQLLERLALYMEKTVAMKSKIKSALMYPGIVLFVAIIAIAIIMIFVVPTFKQVFNSFGAELPVVTMMVLAASDFFVKYWFVLIGILAIGIFCFTRALKTSVALRDIVDRVMLKLPIFGSLVEKASVARWTSTLATMSAAGVPIIESMESVGGASGNYVYEKGTRQIQKEISTGTSLTVAMANTSIFPAMVLQMTAIGEESGALSQMLSKVAEMYEQEVDTMVSGLSSLIEPLIMVMLAVMVGFVVVAMYLPIFKLGDVV